MEDLQRICEASLPVAAEWARCEGTLLERGSLAVGFWPKTKQGALVQRVSQMESRDPSALERNDTSDRKGKLERRHQGLEDPGQGVFHERRAIKESLNGERCTEAV